MSEYKRDKIFLTGIIVLIVIFTILGIIDMAMAKEEQCNGENQFYAHGGKTYSCDNWKGLK